ncbi:MAG: pyridoxamine 5'-phosphate oxidase family protein [Ardenticatenaceae bacterium]|nr:pyridoxamine 5'-phosphate oxidase family protein [Ardenticatenaceae bacterium]
MSRATPPQLSARLLARLYTGMPALLLTVGADGFAHAAYTWAAAPDAQRIRFGADRGSVTIANLQRDGRAALQIVGPADVLFLVKGSVQIVRERIVAAPFPIALVEMTVSEVRDQAWPGVTVAPLAYEWPEDQRDAMRAMEQAVYAELREWEGNE